MEKTKSSIEKMLAVAIKLNFSEDELKELADTYSRAGEIGDEYRRSSGAIKPPREDN